MKGRETFKEKYMDRLILWCLMPFETIFQLYRGGQRIHPCFPGVLLTSTPDNLLLNSMATKWLLFHIIIVETMDSLREELILLLRLSSIPRKEYWPSPGI